MSEPTNILTDTQIQATIQLNNTLMENTFFQNNNQSDNIVLALPLSILRVSSIKSNPPNPIIEATRQEEAEYNPFLSEVEPNHL